MSSLIITQQRTNYNIELSQLQDSLREAEANLAKENNKFTRKARQDILDRIVVVRRSLRIIEDQEAALPKPAPLPLPLPEPVEAKDEVNTPETTDITLSCNDCSVTFSFSSKDQAHHSRNGWDAPKRCGDCRAAKKAARPQDIQISCSDCNTNFVFTIVQQNNFRQNGWDNPKRCSPCVTAKKARQPKPILINCKMCHTDFTFSVSAQKHFTTSGWKNPTHCTDCRKRKPKHTNSDNASKNPVKNI